MHGFKVHKWPAAHAILYFISKGVRAKTTAKIPLYRASGCNAKERILSVGKKLDF